MDGGAPWVIITYVRGMAAAISIIYVRYTAVRILYSIPATVSIITYHRLTKVRLGAIAWSHYLILCYLYLGIRYGQGTGIVISTVALPSSHATLFTAIHTTIAKLCAIIRDRLWTTFMFTYIFKRFRKGLACAMQGLIHGAS